MFINSSFERKIFAATIGTAALVVAKKAEDHKDARTNNIFERNGPRQEHIDGLNSVTGDDMQLSLHLDNPHPTESKQAFGAVNEKKSQLANNNNAMEGSSQSTSPDIGLLPHPVQPSSRFVYKVKPKKHQKGQKRKKRKKRKKYTKYAKPPTDDPASTPSPTKTSKSTKTATTTLPTDAPASTPSPNKTPKSTKPAPAIIAASTKNTKCYKGTCSPSDAPSSLPSASSVPSSIPSGTPSESVVPSDAPNMTPSTIPSFRPSLSPSALPSATESVSPSDIPSARPSDAPSASPSSFPSATPSKGTKLPFDTVMSEIIACAVQEYYSTDGLLDDPSCPEDPPYGQMANWDVSEVTSFYDAFYAPCTRLYDTAAYHYPYYIDWANVNQIIEKWDVSSATDLGHAFYTCEFGFNFPDLSSWDVSNVEDTKSMFERSDFNDRSIVDWKLKKVTSMRGMFAHNANFNQDLSDWGYHIPDNADIGYMFNATAAFNQCLENWAPKNPIRSNTFSNAADCTDQTDSGWCSC